MSAMLAFTGGLVVGGVIVGLLILLLIVLDDRSRP